MKKILLAAILGITSFVSYANGHEPASDRGANVAEVRYIAGNDGDVLFNVVYNNAAGSRFSVIVLDEFGNQIYQGFFYDKKFNKKFKLADPESTSKLTFIIRNYSNNSVQRFQADAANYLVEDTRVTEVK